MANSLHHSAKARLLRKGYNSLATDDRREYLLYLPVGYDAEPGQRWPLILFLHGGGERGDGRDELDYILRHGPLAEAWIYHRELPFIIISPQLPLFEMHDQLRTREGIPKPQRLQAGAPPREDEDRPGQPMRRAAEETPSVYGVTEAWGRSGPPGGWQLCEAELLAMVDETLRDYRADPDRVYLTGLSYGGYGTWHLATAHPERWAAVAPICGGGNSDLVHRLAEAQLPIWIFQGGRDPVIKAEWIYTLANALEQAGHRSIRLTIHEDLGHDAWSRVYAGEDLYHWFLAHRRR